MQSPIYWHPILYRAAMKMSYGDQFMKRYEMLDKHIPEGAEVFEVCMGDAYFYHNYLAKKNVRYSCGDINPAFVNSAKQKGLNASLLNVFNDAIPKADYILMHASLSYFIPQEASIVLKLLASAGKKVILAESVHNLSNSSSGIKSALGTFLSKAKAGQAKIKFTRETLKTSFEPFMDQVEVWEEDEACREVIIVLSA